MNRESVRPNQFFRATTANDLLVVSLVVAMVRVGSKAANRQIGAMRWVYSNRPNPNKRDRSADGVDSLHHNEVAGEMVKNRHSPRTRREREAEAQTHHWATERTAFLMSLTYNLAIASIGRAVDRENRSD